MSQLNSIKRSPNIVTGVTARVLIRARSRAWLISGSCPSCVAARLGLEPVAVNKSDTRKIIDGAIFSSDPWRIHLLMLIAISKTGDVHIVSEPGDMIRIANSLAAAGLPKVIEMLKDGDDVPIWNLSESIDEILREK